MTNHRPGLDPPWLHHALIFIYFATSPSFLRPALMIIRSRQPPVPRALLCYYAIIYLALNTSPSHLIWLKQLPRENNFTVNIISSTSQRCLSCSYLVSEFIFCVYFSLGHSSEPRVISEILGWAHRLGVTLTRPTVLQCQAQFSCLLFRGRAQTMTLRNSSGKRAVCHKWDIGLSS